MAVDGKAKLTGEEFAELFEAEGCGSTFTVGEDHANALRKLWNALWPDLVPEVIRRKLANDHPADRDMLQRWLEWTGRDIPGTHRHWNELAIWCGLSPNNNLTDDWIESVLIPVMVKKHEAHEADALRAAVAHATTINRDESESDAQHRDPLTVLRELRAKINPLKADALATRATTLEELREQLQHPPTLEVQQRHLEAIKKQFSEAPSLFKTVISYCEVERVAQSLAAAEIIAPPLPQNLHAHELRKAFAEEFLRGKPASTANDEVDDKWRNRRPISDWHDRYWAAADQWLAACIEQLRDHLTDNESEQTGETSHDQSGKVEKVDEVPLAALNAPNPAKKLLVNWYEIADAVGRGNDDKFRRLIKRLSDERDGPIRVIGQGKQPELIERDQLVKWWNGLAEQHENAMELDEEHAANVAGSVGEGASFRHGRSAVVLPEIGGSEKKRRNARPR